MDSLVDAHGRRDASVPIPVASGNRSVFCDKHMKKEKIQLDEDVEEEHRRQRATIQK